MSVAVEATAVWSRLESIYWYSYLVEVSTVTITSALGEVHLHHEKGGISHAGPKIAPRAYYFSLAPCRECGGCSSAGINALAAKGQRHRSTSDQSTSDLS